MILGRFARKTEAPPEPAPSEQELQITRGLKSLRNATVREVMTPRVDVAALAAPVKFVDVARAVRRTGHSHFPVYESDLDRLVGVLFVKDLFRLVGTRDVGDGETESIAASLDVTDRLREPYVVPESRSALEVLADMRRRRRGIAVVVDEYGGLSGIVTINDLVSELVGDLHDEFDRSATPAVLRIDQDRFLVDGACSIDEIREEVGINVPDGEYVTVGGFILDVLGHIPEEGEELQRPDCTIRVTQMDRHRIAKVVVQVQSATIHHHGGEAASAGK